MQHWSFTRLAPWTLFLFPSKIFRISVPVYLFRRSTRISRNSATARPIYFELCLAVHGLLTQSHGPTLSLVSLPNFSDSTQCPPTRFHFPTGTWSSDWISGMTFSPYPHSTWLTRFSLKGTNRQTKCIRTIVYGTYSFSCSKWSCGHADQSAGSFLPTLKSLPTLSISRRYLVYLQWKAMLPW